MKSKQIAIVLSGLLAFSATTAMAQVDEADAMKLLDSSKCLKCHSVDKKKDGPSYKEVAAKYKGKADAVAKLTKHVTEPSKVKVDGEEEDHGTLQTRGPGKVKNRVNFILTR